MSASTPAIFVADSAGLDFLNSVATPHEEPVDWLDNGEDFIAWLRQAGLVPQEQLAVIVEQAMPGEIDRVADQARDLREWFRGFVRRHKGHELDAEALEELDPLNRLLERDEAYGRIMAGADRRLAYRTMRRWRSPETLLIPLGEAIARLTVEEDFSQVKACEGHNCTLLFVDRTRGRARRWCSMSVCGNRAKVAAHRSRTKAK